MEYLTTNVPSTLFDELKVLENVLNLLIINFNKRCADENERIREERAKRRNSRIFEYSIKTIEDGWRILYKEATNPIGEDSDKSWSKPFKIINGVLFYREHAFKGSHNTDATNLIPQGLFDESTLEQINKDW